MSPAISRNLISISKLDHDGFAFNFEHGLLKVFKNVILVGNGFLYDGLYRLRLYLAYAQSLYIQHINYWINIGMKRKVINENSSNLWHKKLGRISRERMVRLVKDELLSNIDFTDFSVCIDCIKGKQAKTIKKIVEKCIYLVLWVKHISLPSLKTTYVMVTFI